MPRNTEDKVAGGPIGKLVGLFKRAAGTVADDENLAREGRLQEAQSEADIEARSRTTAADAQQSRADLARDRLDAEAEHARLSIDVEEASRRQQADQEREKAADAERAARAIERKESHA